MDVTGDVALELALDEYLHMLERVAPWMLQATEDSLRPFCHWLYARTAFDVPLREVDPITVAAYLDAARLDPGAAGMLREGLAALQRFAGQQPGAS